MKISGALGFLVVAVLVSSTDSLSHFATNNATQSPGSIKSGGQPVESHVLLSSNELTSQSLPGFMRSLKENPGHSRSGKISVLDGPAALVTWGDGTTTLPSSAAYVICASGDGTTLAAAKNNGAGSIYRSLDSGSTWTPGTGLPSLIWDSIACSSDGVNMAASQTATGEMYYSTDSGASWAISTESRPDYLYSSIASNVDGSLFLATFCSFGDGMYTQLSPTDAWSGAVSTDDCTATVSADRSGYMYLYQPTSTTTSFSASNGASFTVMPGLTGLSIIQVTFDTTQTHGVAITSTGSKYTAGGAFGTWTSSDLSSVSAVSQVAMDDSGQYVCITNVWAIYSSSDYGATFAINYIPAYSTSTWTSLTVSSDANTMYLASFDTSIPPIFSGTRGFSAVIPSVAPSVSPDSVTCDVSTMYETPGETCSGANDYVATCDFISANKDAICGTAASGWTIQKGAGDCSLRGSEYDCTYEDFVDSGAASVLCCIGTSVTTIAPSAAPSAAPVMSTSTCDISTLYESTSCTLNVGDFATDCAFMSTHTSEICASSAGNSWNIQNGADGTCSIQGQEYGCHYQDFPDDSVASFLCCSPASSTTSPSFAPSAVPSAAPSAVPSVVPSVVPSAVPSVAPVADTSTCDITTLYESASCTLNVGDFATDCAFISTHTSEICASSAGNSWNIQNSADLTCSLRGADYGCVYQAFYDDATSNFLCCSPTSTTTSPSVAPSIAPNFAPSASPSSVPVTWGDGTTTLPSSSTYVIAASSDGTALAAALTSGEGGIYYSAASGTDWTVASGAPSVTWGSIASGSGGQNMIAAQQGSGQLYFSTSYGAAWAIGNPSSTQTYSSVASNIAGTVFLASYCTSNTAYIDIVSPTSVTTKEMDVGCTHTVSADRSGKMFAYFPANPTTSYTSDFGTNWFILTALNGLVVKQVTFDTSFQKGVAVHSSGVKYTITGSNGNWYESSGLPTSAYTQVAMDDSGQYVVVTSGASIYSSSDYGANFVLNNQGTYSSSTWNCLLTNTDGSVVYMTSTDTTIPPIFKGTRFAVITTTSPSMSPSTAPVGTPTTAPFAGDGYAISTFAGNAALFSSSGVGGQATSAGFANLRGTWCDSDGNVYLLDAASSTPSVLKVGTDNVLSLVQTFSASTTYFITGSTVESQTFFVPSSDNYVYKVTQSGPTASYGTGTAVSSGDNGPATSASFNGPFCAWMDSVGALYLTETGSNKARRISAGENPVVTTVVGGGSDFSDGIAATSARISGISGMTGDSFGVIYVADYTNGVVRKLVTSTGLLTSVGGVFTAPQSLWADSSGGVYVTDYTANLVKFIPSALTSASIVVAGNGVWGNSGDGGPATSAAIKLSYGMSGDTARSVYVSSSANVVRRIVAPSTPPTYAPIIAPTAPPSALPSMVPSPSPSDAPSLAPTYGLVNICGVGPGTTGSGNNAVVLTCPSGYIINEITFASYGTPTGSCGAYAKSSCDSSTTLSLNSAACLGLNTCNRVADSAVYGDVCSGMGKWMFLQATCREILAPTLAPVFPSIPPSIAPSLIPSVVPSVVPSCAPSMVPSQLPSLTPSVLPSISPSIAPSTAPTSNAPVATPTTSPSISPSVSPSTAPSAPPVDGSSSCDISTLYESTSCTANVGDFATDCAFMSTYRAEICASPVDSGDNQWNIQNGADGTCAIKGSGYGCVYQDFPFDTNTFLCCSPASGSTGNPSVAPSLAPSAPSADYSVVWNDGTSTLPSGVIYTICVSADGTKLAAATSIYAGGIYYSTASGSDWTIASGAPSDVMWSGIACSTSGQNMIAYQQDSAVLYFSTNYGVSWSVGDSAPANQYGYAASNLDGSAFLVTFCVEDDYLEIPFLATVSPTSFTSVAVEGDCSNIVTADRSGYMYLYYLDFAKTMYSTDDGATWTEIVALAEFPYLFRVTFDVTRTHGVAVYSGGIVYTSGGVNGEWFAPSGVGGEGFLSVAMDDTGRYVTAVSDFSLYSSSDYGVSYEVNTVEGYSNTAWNIITSSSDGTVLYLTASNNNLHPFFKGTRSIDFSSTSAPSTAVTSAPSESPTVASTDAQFTVSVPGYLTPSTPVLIPGITTSTLGVVSVLIAMLGGEDIGGQIVANGCPYLGASDYQMYILYVYVDGGEEETQLTKMVSITFTLSNSDVYVIAAEAGYVQGDSTASCAVVTNAWVLREPVTLAETSGSAGYGVTTLVVQYQQIVPTPSEAPSVSPSRAPSTVPTAGATTSEFMVNIAGYLSASDSVVIPGITTNSFDVVSVASAMLGGSGFGGAGTEVAQDCLYSTETNTATYILYVYVDGGDEETQLTAMVTIQFILYDNGVYVMGSEAGYAAGDQTASCSSVIDAWNDHTPQSFAECSDCPQYGVASLVVQYRQLTVVPSATPSLSPSAAPSLTPSVAPSAAAVVPSFFPIFTPTLSPSLVLATDTPSVVPSVISSTGPSVAPSRTPSVTPSLMPSASPSWTPSVTPSAAPSTKAPSVVPSASPSAVPVTSSPVTKAPSASPTRSPTKLTSITTITCTVTQSLSNVLYKTFLSSADSKSIFTSVMSTFAATSKVGSSFNFSITSVSDLSRRRLEENSLSHKHTLSNTQVVVKMSYQLTAAANGDAAYSYANVTGSYLSYVTGGSFTRQMQALAISRQNTIVSEASSSSVTFSEYTVTTNTLSPTARPTAVPSYTRTAAPSFANIATVIKSKHIPVVSKTSLTYAATFTAPAVYAGNMYCAALTTTSNLTSVAQVSTAGFSSPYLVGAMDVNVTVSGLIPVTTYNVYCYTQNVLGAANNLTVVLATKKAQKTVCCKTVDFTNRPVAVYGEVLKKYTSSTPTSTFMFVYSLSNPPNNSLTVTPVIRTSTGATQALVTAVPTSRTFLSTAGSLAGTFYLSAGATVSGGYSVTLKLTGPSSPNFRSSLTADVTLVASNAPTPPPVLSSAQFGDTGAYAFIAFDSATDKAGISLNSWPCSQVFAFNGSSTTSCSWVNSTFVKATFAPYTSGGHFLVLNSSVTLLTNKIKTSWSSNCSGNAYATTRTVLVIGASNPVTPSVLLRTPQVVSNCANFTIDASLSAGSGGRAWSAAVWTVTTSDSTLDNSALLAKLNSYGTNVNMLIQISPSLLENTRYSLSLTLTNFMGLSSSTTVQVAVSFNPNFPTLSILGSTIVSIKPSAVLDIYASASPSSCALTKSVIYSWQLKLNNAFQTNIVSISKDSKNYQLSGYTLSPQTVYEAVVTATVPAVGIYNATTATASVTIQVTKGDVVAVVVGGYSRSLAISLATPLVLDASKSYDEDLGTSSGSTLSYKWTCSLVSLANYGNDCSSAFGTQSLTLSTISLASTLLDKANTYGIQVQVYSADLRQDSKIVAVQNLYDSTQTLQTASTLITTTSTKFNADTQVTLFGSISATYALTAVWSATVSGVSSSFVSLTSQSKDFLAAQSVSNIQFPLAVAGGNFIAGSIVTFRLGADQLGISTSNHSRLYSFAEVLLEVNSPPSSGSVDLSPSSGEALSTLFSLITTGWVDDVADYPLTFDYTYKSIPSAPALSIKSRDTLNSVSTFFPAGSESLDYTFVITASAYDVYLASSSATADITVTPAVNLNVSDFLVNSLGNALSTSDNSLAVQTVNNVANTFNVVNCSAANATTCASLNRDQCYSVPNTCGACVSGFLGVVGPANTKCFNSSGSDSPRMPGESCSDSDACLYGNCANSICQEPLLACPTSVTEYVCSGHGSCSYADLSGNSLAPCPITSTRCVASCNCTDAYGGADCSLTPEEVLSRDSDRSSLCDAIVTVSNSSNPSVTLLDSLIGSLLVSYSPAEVLSSEAVTNCNAALTTVSNLAASGLLVGFSSSSLNNLVLAASKFAVTSSNSTLNDGSQLSASVASITSGVFQSMVDGQAATNIVSDNIRLSVLKEVTSSLTNVSLSPPATDSDAAYGALQPNVQFDGNALDACDDGSGYSQLSIMSWGTNPYPNSTNIGSPLLRTDTTGSSSSRRLRTYSNSGSTVDLNFTAVYFLTLQFSTKQDFNFTVDLNSPSSNVTFPACRFYDGANYVPCKGCSVSSYTNYNVTYGCNDITQMCGSNSGRRLSATQERLDELQSAVESGRRLTDSEQSELYNMQRFLDSDSGGISQIGAIFALLAEELASTLTSFNPFAIDAKKAAPILAFISILIFLIFFGLAYFSRWDRIDHNNMIYLRDKEKEKKKMLDKYHASLHQKKTKLTDYLNFKKSVKSEHNAEQSISAALFHASVVRPMGEELENPFGAFSEKFAEKEHVSVFGNVMTPRDDEYSTSYKMLFIDDDQFSEKTPKKRNGSGSPAIVFDSSSHSAAVNYQTNPIKYNSVQDVEEVVPETELFCATVQSEDPVEKVSKKDKNTTKKLHEPVKSQSETIIETVNTYLNEVMPDEMQSKTLNVFYHFTIAVFRNHDYTSMFTRGSINVNRTARWLNLSYSTMLSLFVDTLFFGIFLPNTVGMCSDLSAFGEDACLTGQNKATAAPNCVWNADSTAEYGGSCEFRDPPEDIYFTMIIVLLTTICTVPLQMAFDYVRVEYCSKRPDFSVFGWNSEYMVGRATQDLGKGMGTETALKTLYDKVDRERDAQHGEILAKSPRSVVADKTSVDEKTLKALKKQFLHNNLIASKVYMDTNSAEEETNTFIAEMKAYVERHVEETGSHEIPWQHTDANTIAADNRFKTICKVMGLNPDGSAKPLTLRQWFMYSDLKSRMLAKIDKAREGAEEIEGGFEDVGEDNRSDQDISLIQYFILEQFTPFKRYCLRSQFFFFPVTSPRKIHPTLWLMSWIFMIGSMIFFLYWMLAWAVTQGGATFKAWGLNYVIGFLQDVFIIQILKVYIFYIVAMDSIRSQLNYTYRMLSRVAIAYAQDTHIEDQTGGLAALAAISEDEKQKRKKGKKHNKNLELHNRLMAAAEYTNAEDEVSVIQHMSPACRVARRIKHRDLASARILRRVTDNDIAVCRINNHTHIAAFAFIVVAIPVVFGILSETLGDVMLDIMLPGFLTGFILINSLISEASVAAIIALYLVGAGYVYWRFFMVRGAKERVLILKGATSTGSKFTGESSKDTTIRMEQRLARQHELRWATSNRVENRRSPWMFFVYTTNLVADTFSSFTLFCWNSLNVYKIYLTWNDAPRAREQVWRNMNRPSLIVNATGNAFLESFIAQSMYKDKKETNEKTKKIKYNSTKNISDRPEIAQNLTIDIKPRDEEYGFAPNDNQTPKTPHSNESDSVTNTPVQHKPVYISSIPEEIRSIVKRGNTDHWDNEEEAYQRAKLEQEQADREFAAQLAFIDSFSHTPRWLAGSDKFSTKEPVFDEPLSELPAMETSATAAEVELEKAAELREELNERYEIDYVTSLLNESLLRMKPEVYVAAAHKFETEAAAVEAEFGTNRQKRYVPVKYRDNRMITSNLNNALRRMLQKHIALNDITTSRTVNTTTDEEEEEEDTSNDRLPGETDDEYDERLERQSAALFESFLANSSKKDATVKREPLSILPQLDLLDPHTPPVAKFGQRSALEDLAARTGYGASKSIVYERPKTMARGVTINVPSQKKAIDPTFSLGEYQEEVSAFENYQQPVHVSVVSAIVRDIFDIYRPDGFSLSTEERDEIKEAFVMWLEKKRFKNNFVPFSEFRVWFYQIVGVVVKCKTQELGLGVEQEGRRLKLRQEGKAVSVAGQYFANITREIEETGYTGQGQVSSGGGEKKPECAMQ